MYPVLEHDCQIRYNKNNREKNEKAPEDDLNFYLSYAKKEEKILGSRRFLVPFMNVVIIFRV